MARGQDLSNTLTMLHTTLMQTGTNLQDALNKGIGQLEASGQSGQQATTDTVVAELSRMRNDLRDTRNRLAASRDELSEEVRTAITLLRQEIQKVKDAVGDRPVTEAELQARLAESPDPGPWRTVAAPYPDPDPVEAAASDQILTAVAADSPSPTTEDDDPPLAEPLPAVPAPRAGPEDKDQTPALEEQLQQAVRAVLTDEIAPLHTFFADLKDAQAAQATARDEQRRELNEIGRELAALATSFEGWQVQQAEAGAGSAAPEVTSDHSSLLRQAARVSSALLVCHRDMWEFVTAYAGRHPHFRVPPQITDHGKERISTTISGRSLIAVLITLYSIKHSADEGDGDWELATTLYDRVQHQLTTLASDGEPVTITLDDRSHPNPDSADDADGAT